MNSRLQSGLSPRVRGSGIHASHLCRVMGLSPRVRGSPPARMANRIANKYGLSPRVRGSPLSSLDRVGAQRDKRSIPASAGQPRRWRRSNAGAITGGLSPRVRGSHELYLLLLPRNLPRSIPASAGQPSASTGTTVEHSGQGLSPRVRGSQRGQRIVSPELFWRSIPASAGQPGVLGRAQGLDGVYPRECGAARTKRPRSRVVTVYPRECGAACTMTGPPVRGLSGLSPRVRGSRPTVASVALPQCRRSIPASAGQPRAGLVGRDRHAVYPRECGAAMVSDIDLCLCRGLSPRVRGSL